MEEVLHVDLVFDGKRGTVFAPELELSRNGMKAQTEPTAELKMVNGLGRRFMRRDRRRRECRVRLNGLKRHWYLLRGAGNRLRR